MPKKMKERVYKVGGADPRTGPERMAGLVNRVMQGGRKMEVRSWDDTASERARKTKKKGGAK